MPASCIIPFYNESQRLDPIVNLILSCEDIHQLILIDDGSTDGGYNLDSKYSSKLLIHQFRDNRGKAAAMRHGFNLAKFDTVIFIDADLKGLKHTNIRDLLQPVLSGETHMTVSMREHISFFDVVSGERVLRKEQWREFFEESDYQRNAMEIAMNYYAFSNHLNIQWIPWTNVTQTYKSQKVSWGKGVYRDVKNVVDWIFQLGIFPFGCTYFLSWLMINCRGSRFTDWYYSFYLKIYGKQEH